MNRQRENPHHYVTSASHHERVSNLARRLARTATDSYDLDEMVKHYRAIMSYFAAVEVLLIHRPQHTQTEHFVAVAGIVPGKWCDRLVAHQSTFYGAEHEVSVDGPENPSDNHPSKQAAIS